MSDKHVSQEPLLDASAQKPKYEAPAIVDLTRSVKGAGGHCVDGSSDSEHCNNGGTAGWICYAGSVAGDFCDAGSSGEPMP